MKPEWKAIDDKKQTFHRVVGPTGLPIDMWVQYNHLEKAWTGQLHGMRIGLFATPERAAEVVEKRAARMAAQLLAELLKDY